jgi:uncharacterized protein YdaU (DUF1376 family)
MASSRTKAPAFQFYPADWVMSTRTMPAEARGVYIDLLSFSWTEGGLPDDLDGLHGYVGLTPAKFKVIWAKHLSHRFESNGDGKLLNPRQEVEREKQRAWREKSAKGGRAKPKATGNHP